MSYQETPEQCVQAAIRSLRYGAHPHKSPHADALEKLVGEGAFTSPIPMVLYCPTCGVQHIDAPDPCRAEMCESGCVQPGECSAWTNPPHRSHLCSACGFIWRPADVPTTGVAAIKTKGKDDNPFPLIQVR